MKRCCWRWWSAVDVAAAGVGAAAAGPLKYFWGPVGIILELSRCSLRALLGGIGVLMRFFWKGLDALLGFPWGRLGAILEPWKASWGLSWKPSIKGRGVPSSTPHSGAIKPPLGALVGRYWGSRGRCWSRLGAVLGPAWSALGALLGASCGPIGALLGASWGSAGPSLGRLGALLGRFGTLLGTSWAVLGRYWGFLEPS